MPSRDYFAELYVAGLLGDCGWSIYFPKRDVGFDFIISKQTEQTVIIRPVQVKGKYPEPERTEGRVYGYIGELSQIHNEMVLAIPYFPTNHLGDAPDCIAFMPRWRISTQTSRGWSCCPAVFRDDRSHPRPSYEQYFGRYGISFMETPDWSIRPPDEQLNANEAVDSTASHITT